MTRRAGITIPLFSLRVANRPVGEIPDLVPFARWAKSAGFSVVQILPVSEPAGGESSPYAARTSFALDPVYLAVPGDTGAPSGGDRVDWGAVRAHKQQAIGRAFARFQEHATPAERRELDAFAATEAHWLDDYTLFAALHDEQGGGSWYGWPAPLRARDPATLEAARLRLAQPIGFFRYTQWQLDRQWRAAKREARELGVELMGDLPFMVAGDSADVWARAADFRLDARAGAPPDAFSDEGQDWGLPVFRWDVMAANDFAWLRARARRAADLYRYYRVDHVVGLYRTFYRPDDDPKHGRFTPEGEEAQLALGERVLGILDGGEGRVIAEDLGVIPPFVRTSLARLKIPGYRVLRWEKDDDVFRDPMAWPAASVATTGTHDTESMSDWFDALGERERAAFQVIGPKGTRFDDDVRDELLRLVYASPSDLALIPFQDAFGSRERINVPGTVTGENWTYRMPRSIEELMAEPEHRARLLALSRATNRT